MNTQAGVAEALTPLLKEAGLILDRGARAKLIVVIADAIAAHESPLAVQVVWDALRATLAENRRKALDELPELRTVAGRLRELGRILKDESFSHFHAAAAGELIGLTDRAAFQQLLQQFGPWVKYDALRIRADNRRPGNRAKLRAAIWVATTSPKTVTRREPALLTALQRSLNEYLAQMVVPPVDKTANRLTPADAVTFVPREHYSREFHTALTSGAQFIAFVGEPGNGKSRLADELLTAVIGPDDSRKNLRAHDATILMTDMAGILADRELHRMHDLTQAFASYVSSTEAPTYIVVDNLDDDYTLVDKLFPLTTRSTVVLTSRGNCLPEGRGQTIVVNAMDIDEAVAVTKYLLPDVSDRDAHLLVDTFGGRPLALEHVTKGLLTGQRVTPSELCAAFEADAAEVMRRTKSKDQAEVTLTWIYETQVKYLQDADTKAAWLLQLIAFMAPEDLPMFLLQLALETALPPKNSKLGEIEFEAALRQLQERHLVGAHDQHFSMHSFTQAIHRSILRNREVETCRLIVDLIGHNIDHPLLPSDKSKPVHFRANLTPHLLQIVRGFENANPGEFPKFGLGKIVESLIRSLRWHGEAFDLHRLNPIMKRMRDPDMQEVGASPEWIEARRDWAGAAWEFGILPPDAYIADVTGISANSFTARPPEYLTITEATGIFANSIPLPLPEYLNIMDAFIDLKGSKYSLRLIRQVLSDTGLSRRDQAEAWCFRGEISVTRALWNQAESSLKRAIEFCAGEGDPRWRWIVRSRAQKGLVDVAVFGGREDLATRMPDYLGELLKLDNQIGTSDELDLARAYIHHGYARLTGRVLMLAGADLVRNPSTIPVGEGWRHDKEAEMFIRNIAFAMRFYANAGALRASADLQYEVRTLKYLLEPLYRDSRVVSRMLTERLAPMAEIERLLSELADEKANILAGDVRPGALVRLGRIADSFAAREAPYWHCETLLTACGAAICAGENFDEILPPLLDGLEQLGRLDRRQPLLDSLDTFNADHDLAEFMKVFAFILVM